MKDSANPANTPIESDPVIEAYKKDIADQYSDIDLLIIGDRPEQKWSRRLEIGKIRRSLSPSNIPVDILFFTPQEVQKWRSTTNHIISEAFQKGEILYERP
jgi:hypothetical protein